MKVFLMKELKLVDNHCFCGNSFIYGSRYRFRANKTKNICDRTVYCKSCYYTKLENNKEFTCYPGYYTPGSIFEVLYSKKDFSFEEELEEELSILRAIYL